ncbi:cytochrome b/b6 domain-containing protein [Catenovulum agarivorans]|uniref:cytochrome b/b6 domain-containing protein n=1 Tax=Catenovulum agarivorans TaxID=1172192 RepID=UPI0003061701|nr:cytochrome b/b6 domain-containing protein [Catenovulum agarivorans]
MKQIKVWDFATRLFHWLLVTLILAAWYTIENRMIEQHELIGHALLGLIIFRICWGFIGSTTARFTHFLTSPLSALSYLKASLTLNAPHSSGHNPAGGWMVIMMLLIIGFQLLSGMYANDDLGFSGALSDSITKDMSDTFTQLHAINFNILVALIWLHLVAVFFYLLVKNENLVRAMFSGKKPVNQINPQDQLNFKPLLQAMVCLLASVGLGFWLMV